jgi:hypothetical protein
MGFVDADDAVDCGVLIRIGFDPRLGLEESGSGGSHHRPLGKRLRRCAQRLMLSLNLLVVVGPSPPIPASLDRERDLVLAR